jgi:predicted Zn-dependent protease
MNPESRTDTMNTFTFNTDELMTISTARRAVQQWAKRRAFPIVIVEITQTAAIVQLAAPDAGTHNRSVNALARILQRQLDRQHALVSRLVPTH